LSQDEKCDYVTRSGPSDLLDRCGESAGWRTENGMNLCDKHKVAIEGEQPDRKLEKIERE
jgi:hypothetical protein